MTLKIQRPGTYSVLTGPVHIGLMHQGVPQGGPADKHSWMIGNALVGNDTRSVSDNCKALEITLTGPRVQATRPVRLVLAGAAFEMKVENDRGTRHIHNGHVFLLQEGDILDIGECRQGMRSYLCTPGGFRFAELKDAGLAQLKSGDQLLSNSSTESGLLCRWIEPEPWHDQPLQGTLRILPGTHGDMKWLHQVTKATFNVTKESNRMGIRLTTELKNQQRSDTKISSPVVPGTLQWPNGGEPILLGVDAQTIGGYPRYGHVISADMDALGQLKQGDTIHFQLIAIQEAERLMRSRNRWQQILVNRLLSTNQL